MWSWIKNMFAKIPWSALYAKGKEELEKPENQEKIKDAAEDMVEKIQGKDKK